MASAHGLHAAARIEALIQATHDRPASAVAEHSLGAALGDMGDAPGALEAIQRAFQKGGDAPETWLVYARALMSLSRLDEAETALNETLARRANYVDALRDKAQLIWMKTGDAAAALAPIDASLSTDRSAFHLVALRAGIARDILGGREAYQWLEPWLKGGRPAYVDLTASVAASDFDPRLMLKHAGVAMLAAPESSPAHLAYLSALMANGRTHEALPGLDAHLAGAPDDQYAIALRLTAWRVLGDPRTLSSADYQRLTTHFDVETPSGLNREDWLGRAGDALRRLHPFRAQPISQSIKAGVQAALDPRFAGDPDLDTLFRSLEAPIHAFTDTMIEHTDPMSRRRAIGHEIVGAWSVRLTAGGHHTDHVHPNGWVSSALYVETPAPSVDDPKAGWLRFGACRLGVGLELPPEYWIEPSPGRVALFPSWMWHGTEPFTGGGERLTIAFDVQPR